MHRGGGYPVWTTASKEIRRGKEWSTTTHFALMKSLCINLWYATSCMSQNFIRRIKCVRGTLKFQHSDSATHATLCDSLCDRPPKKLHQVATPIDHPVCAAYGLPLPHHSPFYFCALLLPSYSISISFHILFPILSIFHILPLSLFHDPLLVAMHSVPYVAPLRSGSP